MITQNIIGFQLSALSSRELHETSAATTSNLKKSFSPATVTEVNMALEKAHQAWRTFRNLPGLKRADFLRQIANGIELSGDQLVSCIMEETAYPEARILGERNRTCAQLRMFADIAEQELWRELTIDVALPDRTLAPRPELRKMMMALGPVVVFGASNFPLAYSTAGGDVASAFAVGCPVIVKAHDAHPCTNALVAEVIMEAARRTNMPDGVFSSLNGDGFETGKQLVLHPLTAAVGFTGSQAGGRALFDLGQSRPKPIPVFAEMGSVNPVFLLPGKIKENVVYVASQLIASITLSVGQFCTKPGIFIALDDEHSAMLINEFKKGLAAVQKGTMLSNDILNRFQKGVTSIKAQSGVQFVSDDSSEVDSKVSPVLASVAADIFLKESGLQHEIFGPFALLVLCNSITQMKLVAEKLEGQLTSSIFMNEQDHTDAKDLVEVLIEKAGRVIVNGVPTGVEVCAAMTHGGPYPASSDSRFTAVGHSALRRWVRPVTFQNFPANLLPEILQ